jgi:alanyl-tRNA synthetase
MANAIKDVTSIIQGGGGGTARLAQAGGRAPKRLNEALKILKENVLLQIQKI